MCTPGRHMKRVVIASMILIVGLFLPGALLVSRTHVPTSDIERRVTRKPELLSKAWQLPVATTCQTKVIMQSNGSRCGPAAIANANRSLGIKKLLKAMYWLGRYGVGQVYASWV